MGRWGKEDEKSNGGKEEDFLFFHFSLLIFFSSFFFLTFASLFPQERKPTKGRNPAVSAQQPQEHPGPGPITSQATANPSEEKLKALQAQLVELEEQKKINEDKLDKLEEQRKSDNQKIVELQGQQALTLAPAQKVEVRAVDTNKGIVELGKDSATDAPHAEGASKASDSSMKEAPGAPPAIVIAEGNQAPPAESTSPSHRAPPETAQGVSESPPSMSFKAPPPPPTPRLKIDSRTTTPASSPVGASAGKRKILDVEGPSCKTPRLEPLELNQLNFEVGVSLVLFGFVFALFGFVFGFGFVFVFAVLQLNFFLHLQVVYLLRHVCYTLLEDHYLINEVNPPLVAAGFEPILIKGNSVSGHQENLRSHSRISWGDFGDEDNDNFFNGSSSSGFNKDKIVKREPLSESSKMKKKEAHSDSSKGKETNPWLEESKKNNLYAQSEDSVHFSFSFILFFLFLF